jgi:hypothetical protein
VSPDLDEQSGTSDFIVSGPKEKGWVADREEALRKHVRGVIHHPPFRVSATRLRRRIGLSILFILLCLECLISMFGRMLTWRVWRVWREVVIL